MAHHGNTPAAWTGVVLVLIGFAVSGFGIVLDNWLIFWIGVLFAPIAGVVVKVMQKMGLGSETHAINAER